MVCMNCVTCSFRFLMSGVTQVCETQETRPSWLSQKYTNKKNCLASVIVVWLLFHICWCDWLYMNFKLLPLYWLKLMMTESVWSSLEYALSKLKFCFGLLFPNMFDSLCHSWISTVLCCCRKGLESSVMSWGTHSSKVIYSSVENKLRVQWVVH